MHEITVKKSSRRASVNFFQVALTMFFFVTGFSAFSLAEDDPMDGTWKLNLARSTFNPGPPPKALINSYHSDGKGTVKVITDSTSADGKTTHREYFERYDGKEYSADSASGDTITLKRIDARTVEGVYKRDGKPRSTIRRSVSTDGKTMTTEAQGESATVKGQIYHDLRVFDKQ